MYTLKLWLAGCLGTLKFNSIINVLKNKIIISTIGLLLAYSDETVILMVMRRVNFDQSLQILIACKSLATRARQRGKHVCIEEEKSLFTQNKTHFKLNWFLRTFTIIQRN